MQPQALVLAQVPTISTGLLAVRRFHGSTKSAGGRCKIWSQLWQMEHRACGWLGYTIQLVVGWGRDRVQDVLYLVPFYFDRS